jgi:hypothetical protein
VAEGLDREKQAIQRLAAQHLGVSPRDARLTTTDLVSRDQLAALLALPVDTTDYAPLQDPETGGFYFVFGISDWFADDAPLFT